MQRLRLRLALGERPPGTRGLCRSGMRGQTMPDSTRHSRMLIDCTRGRLPAPRAMDAGADAALGGYLLQQHWRFYMLDVLTCAFASPARTGGIAAPACSRRHARLLCPPDPCCRLLHAAPSADPADFLARCLQSVAAGHHVAGRSYEYISGACCCVPRQQALPRMPACLLLIPTGAAAAAPVRRHALQPALVPARRGGGPAAPCAAGALPPGRLPQHAAAAVPGLPAVVRHELLVRGGGAGQAAGAAAARGAAARDAGHRLQLASRRSGTVGSW
jgi:hypothetical protein